jgi:hypothetical protein
VSELKAFVLKHDGPITIENVNLENEGFTFYAIAGTRFVGKTCVHEDLIDIDLGNGNVIPLVNEKCFEISEVYRDGQTRLCGSKT